MSQAYIANHASQLSNHPQESPQNPCNTKPPLLPLPPPKLFTAKQKSFKGSAFHRHPKKPTLAAGVEDQLSEKRQDTQKKPGHPHNRRRNEFIRSPRQKEESYSQTKGKFTGRTRTYSQKRQKNPKNCPLLIRCQRLLLLLYLPFFFPTLAAVLHDIPLVMICGRAGSGCGKGGRLGGSLGLGTHA